MVRVLPALLIDASAILLLALIADPASAQVQVQKLHSDEAFSLFGSDLSLDSNTLVVSTQANRVDVYQRSGDAWSFSQSLSDPDGDIESEFGSSVAVDGDLLLVGAASDDEHVYRLLADQWTWSANLIGSDTTLGDHFGRSVDLDNGRAVVGAPFAQDPGEQTGAAFIYEYTGPQLGWLQLARLSDSEPADFARLGEHVAIDGDVAVVSQGGDSTLQPAAGAALVFRRLPTGWIHEQKLAPFDAKPLQAFGSDVSVSGDLVAIGSRTDSTTINNGGSVYTYRLENSSWRLDEKIEPADGASAGLFGMTVALVGDRLAIGGNQSALGLTGVGRTELYERVAGSWEWSNTLFPGEPTQTQYFSSSLDIHGDWIVAGAPFDAQSEPYAGATYIFSLTEFAASFCFCDAAAPCGNASRESGCLNGSGSGATLQASGSASVATDDLVLTASGLPANRPAIVCVGAGRGLTTLGDGQLCLSDVGGIRRFPVGASDESGFLTIGPGLVAYSQDRFSESVAFRAGSTRHFQTWFRDPQGPCGSMTNLTHGLTVAFGL